MTREHLTKDETGRRYGRLTVLSKAPATKKGQVKWLCQCDCGTERVVRGDKLRSGSTISCGCLSADQSRVHGLRSHPLYDTWNGIVQRCTNPNYSAYAGYGGRGVSICDRWLSGEDGLSGVECFLADVGARPSPQHSIDRINNDLGYEPNNVRWATPKEQQRNQRTNRIIEIGGERICLSEACERTGVNYATAGGRLRRGWAPEQIFAGHLRALKGAKP